MRKKLILFDLDGTLMDAAPAIQAAADRVRPRFQLPPLPIRDVHTFLADPVAYGGETALLVPADADGKTRRDALMLFGRHLDVLFTDYAVPYAGVPELLQELAAGQYRLALVAHRITLFLYQWLDLIGWGTRLDTIWDPAAGTSRYPRTIGSDNSASISSRTNFLSAPARSETDEGNVATEIKDRQGFRASPGIIGRIAGGAVRSHSDGFAPLKLPPGIFMSFKY